MKRTAAAKQRVDRARSVAALDRSVDDGFSMWIPRHLDWMRMRNYSKHTVDNREQWLVVFALWCAARGILRPREVTKPILERYRRQLYEHRKPNGKPLTFGSQIGRLAPLKLFFALTIGEVEAVLAQPEVTEPVGLRDRAILELLYSTGMRRSELAALKLADFAAEHGTVFIRQGKGKRDRVVPVGERAIAWVEKYLLDVRPDFVVDAVEDALFLAETGASIEPDTLTHRVGLYVEAANLGKRGSCHLLRHTMATHMLEGGADVRFIQEMLGHASLETTEIYTRVSISALRAVHAATHPAARLKREGGAEAPEPRNPAEHVAAREADLAEEDGKEAER